MDLAESRTVPDFVNDDSKVDEEPGVVPNGDGAQAVNFGGYQDPVGWTGEGSVYHLDGVITATGCPGTDDGDAGDHDDDETGLRSRSSSIFNSLANLSSE